MLVWGAIIGYLFVGLLFAPIIWYLFSRVGIFALGAQNERDQQIRFDDASAFGKVCLWLFWGFAILMLAIVSIIALIKIFVRVTIFLGRIGMKIAGQ